MGSAVAPVRISFRQEAGKNMFGLLGLQARQVLQLMNQRETPSQATGKVGRSMVDTRIVRALPACFLEFVHDFRALSEEVDYILKLLNTAPVFAQIGVWAR